MKHKILSFLTAFAMVFGIIAAPFVNASAEGEQTTVTIHKMEMKNLPNLKTDFQLNEKKTARVGKDGQTEYDGSKIKSENIEKYFGEAATELSGVRFYVYKINDTNKKKAKEIYEKTLLASSDSYKTKEDVEKVEGLTLVKNGDKDYFETTANGVDVPNLDDGYYWFVEDPTSYKDDNGRTITDAAAVPFGLALPVYKANGSRFTTTDKLHVYPKNTLADKPKVDKNFDKVDNNDVKGIKENELIGDNKNLELDLDNNQKDKPTASRNVGDSVPYIVKTEIPKGAKYKKLVWNDVMTKGLTFDKGSLTIEGIELTEGTDYNLQEDDRGFRLELTKDYVENGENKKGGLTKVEEAAANAALTITLKYTATINNDAVVNVTDKNDVALEYSSKPGKEITPKEIKPANQEIEVTKSWDKDGSTEITEEDKNAKVVYTLQEKDGKNWKNVESVLKTYDAENPNGSFNHKFTGLDDNKTYRVIERVSGYEPEYVSEENGKLTITNKSSKEDQKPINPSEPEVVTRGKKFVKMEKNEDVRLKDAKFVVARKIGDKTEYLQPGDSAKKDAFESAQKAYNDAIEAYNKAVKDKADKEQLNTLKETVDSKKVARDQAFKAYQNDMHNWGSKDTAVELVSDAYGAFEITGLQEGTYYLEEKQAPNGYAERKDQIEFNANAQSYTTGNINYNVDMKDTKDALRIDNNKITIPQTGGIGSIIFVVAGLMIMGLAAYKMKANKEQA